MDPNCCCVVYRGRRLDNYSIWITLNIMNIGEYSEQLGQTSCIQRYSGWG